MQMMVGLRDNIRVKIKINFDIPRISHLASLKCIYITRIIYQELY